MKQKLPLFVGVLSLVLSLFVLLAGPLHLRTHDQVGSFVPSTGGALVGTCANRPDASGTGQFYSCTDTPVSYIDDPTLKAWQQVKAPYVSAGGANDAGAFTTAGTVTVTQYGSAMLASMSQDVQAAIGAALTPGSLGVSSTWIVETASTFSGPNGVNYPSFGVAVSTGTSAADTAYAMDIYNNGGVWTCQQTISHPGSGRIALNNNQACPQYFLNGDGQIHLRLLADGTNLHYQIGNDGVWWWDWEIVTTPSSLADYGFVMGNDFAGGGHGLTRALVYKTELKPLNVPQASINGATNASPVVISTSSPHGFLDGDAVAIHGVVTNTGANSGTGLGTTTPVGAGAWLIHVTDSTHFQALGSSGTGTYGGGGVATVISR